MRVKAVGAVLAASFGLAACADILGITDGTPRDDDASFDAMTLDSPASDVATFEGGDAASDVSIDVPTSPLACGASVCNALVEGCCRRGSVSELDAETFTCALASACDGGLFVTCDGPDNCAAEGHPSEICCGAIPDGGSVATSTVCVSPNACTNGVVMCRPGDDEECPKDAGESCLPSAVTIVGFTICKT